MTPDMIISPNESTSQTTAGTKQSQTNSLRLKSHIFSPSISFPRTKCTVKSGENIAYIQSLIARIMSTNISASTSIPNTININTQIMTPLTSSQIVFAVSRTPFTVVTSLIWNTPYAYARRLPYAPPQLLINCIRGIHVLGDLLHELPVVACSSNLSIFVMVISFGIWILSRNELSLLFATVSIGIVITEAVTTVASEIVHCTNHQVNGTMMMPSARRGSIALYPNFSFQKIVPSAMMIRRTA